MDGRLVHVVSPQTRAPGTPRARVPRRHLKHDPPHRLPVDVEGELFQYRSRPLRPISPLRVCRPTGAPGARHGRRARTSTRNPVSPSTTMPGMPAQGRDHGQPENHASTTTLPTTPRVVGGEAEESAPCRAPLLAVDLRAAELDEPLQPGLARLTQHPPPVLLRREVAHHPDQERRPSASEPRRREQHADPLVLLNQPTRGSPGRVGLDRASVFAPNASAGRSAPCNGRGLHERAVGRLRCDFLHRGLREEDRLPEQPQGEPLPGGTASPSPLRGRPASAGRGTPDDEQRQDVPDERTCPRRAGPRRRRCGGAKSCSRSRDDAEEVEQLPDPHLADLADRLRVVHAGVVDRRSSKRELQHVLDRSIWPT